MRTPDPPDGTAGIAIRISVALAFTLTGLDKFGAIQSTYWVPLFDAIGLGQWFRYFTGIVEVVGGLLFLVPAATPVGAILLIMTMLGAMATHIVILRHPANSVFPAVYLIGVVAAYGKLRTIRSGSR